MTPPHSAGIYFLFGFVFFGIIVASSCSRLRSPSAVPWVCLCECVCLGGGCVWRRRLSRAVCRASHACNPPQQIPGSRAGPRPASVVCALAGQLPLGQTYISCPREADFFYKFLRYFFRITVDFQKFFCAVPNCDCRSLRGLFAVCCHKHAVGIIFVI